MQDHRYREVDRGQTKHRLPPAQQFDKQLRAGNEDRPGEAAQQRDRADRAAEIQRLPLCYDGEGRFIEDESLRHAHDAPGGQKLPWLADGGPRQDGGRDRERTDGHGDAPAMPLHPETRQRSAESPA